MPGALLPERQVRQPNRNVAGSYHPCCYCYRCCRIKSSRRYVDLEHGGVRELLHNMGRTSRNAVHKRISSVQLGLGNGDEERFCVRSSSLSAVRGKLGIPNIRPTSVHVPPLSYPPA